MIMLSINKLSDTIAKSRFYASQRVLFALKATPRHFVPPLLESGEWVASKVVFPFSDEGVAALADGVDVLMHLFSDRITVDALAL